MINFDKMDLQTIFETRCSKKKIDQIAAAAASDPALFKKLIHLIVESKPPVPQYASWALQHATDQKPELIFPHIDTLLPLLYKHVHDSVTRAVLRSLMLIDIPDRFHEKIVDRCFTFLEDMQRPTAIKMFSMCVLWNVLQEEPELLLELRRQINIQLPDATAGFKSRGQKIIKSIDALEL